MYRAPYSQRPTFSTYLVIYIGDVHDEFNVKFKVVPHDPPDNVCAHIIPSMAEVRVVVHGWSTSIPGDSSIALIERYEWSLGPCERVPYLQWW